MLGLFTGFCCQDRSSLPYGFPLSPCFPSVLIFFLQLPFDASVTFLRILLRDVARDHERNQQMAQLPCQQVSGLCCMADTAKVHQGFKGQTQEDVENGKGSIQMWTGGMMSTFSKHLADWEGGGYGPMLMTPSVGSSAFI